MRRLALGLGALVAAAVPLAAHAKKPVAPETWLCAAGDFEGDDGATTIQIACNVLDARVRAPKSNVGPAGAHAAGFGPTTMTKS